MSNPTSRGEEKGNVNANQNSSNQNSPSTSKSASSLGLPNPLSALKNRAWKRSLLENEGSNILAAQNFEEEDAEREYISDEENPENKSLNREMDGIVKHFNPKRGRREQKVKGGGSISRKLDVVCGVKMANGKVCRQDLGCGKHNLAAKGGVEGRSGPVEELLKRFKSKMGGEGEWEELEVN